MMQNQISQQGVPLQSQMPQQGVPNVPMTAHELRLYQERFLSGMNANGSNSTTNEQDNFEVF